MTSDQTHRRAGHNAVTGMDAAAATRIGAALVALETELVAAGVAPEWREDVIIMLAARRREERMRPLREARWARIAAARAAAATGAEGDEPGTAGELHGVTR